MVRTISGDLSVNNPTPARFRRPARQLSEGSIGITYSHGIIEDLHHVDVEETAEEVIVTVWVGTKPRAGAGTTTAQARLETMVIKLQGPLLERRVVDGAAPAA